MKRASYREAVRWIADNDEDACTDPTIIAELPSVLLIADIFGVAIERVAIDILKRRVKERES